MIHLASRYPSPVAAKNDNRVSAYGGDGYAVKCFPVDFPRRLPQLAPIKVAHLILLEYQATALVAS